MAIVRRLASPWKDERKRNARIAGVTRGQRVGGDPIVLASGQALDTARALDHDGGRGHGTIGALVGVQRTHELSLYFHE